MAFAVPKYGAMAVALPEMLDMPAWVIDAGFAVCTAPALHLLELLPYLRFVVSADVCPIVFSQPIVGKRSGSRCSCELMHDSYSFGGSVRLNR
jgi:hypothetical protein